MTLLVANEQDIIEDNIRFHHAMGVDNFIVMDNFSTDETAFILQKLAQEFNIHYMVQPRKDYSQSQWVTVMARMAAEQFDADWVINNDADEFWVPQSRNIKKALKKIPKEISSIKVSRFNAVVTDGNSDVLSAFSHPRSTKIFERVSLNTHGEVLPAKIMHRASRDVSVDQGNHNVTGIVGETIYADTLLKILHFPYRTLGIYKNKIQIGGAAYARNETLPKEIGYTWRSHYEKLSNGGLDAFWNQISKTSNEVELGMKHKTLMENSRVVHLLSGLKGKSKQHKIENSIATLISETETQVSAYIDQQINFLESRPSHRRIELPFHYNIEFVLNGAKNHLADLKEITSNPSPKALCDAFPQLRDCFSLFPRNTHMKTFLSEILEVIRAIDVEKLRRDCNGKRVILHISCQHRAELMVESLASFEGIAEDGYHHIVLNGMTDDLPEDELDLSFTYDGRTLTVPTPDTYEHLHRKIFYAFMLLDVLVEPEMVIKIDDDVVLDDAQRFIQCLNLVASEKATYAGRVAGAPNHPSQVHGWHVGKCKDPLIEKRGYQYPLPNTYANGGFGYVLNQQGLAACSYMYLSMKEFFNQRAVGLEDVCTGHAAYAVGLDLFELSDANTKLCIPGLTTKARKHIES